MEFTKPFLACDAPDLSLIRYPVIGMPKIDGVRGINVDNNLVGRSLKAHANLFTTKKFSVSMLNGLDGEFALNNHVSSASLCRDTTGAINTIKGEPNLHWHIFDLVNSETVDLPYIDRLIEAAKLVEGLQQYAEGRCLHIVPHVILKNAKQVEAYYDKCISEGYEGVILRDPEYKHKNGRCTQKQQGYLRLKPTGDTEAIVVKVEEGETNNNPAIINELGQTERSTHQENMIPNGMVGKLHVYGKRIMNGVEEVEPSHFVISPGCMTHSERRYYLQQQEEIIGKLVKYKFFDHGAKDELRMARFHSFRATSDVGK